MDRIPVQWNTGVYRQIIRQVLRRFLYKCKVPRRFQWYIAEGMFSLPATKYSMVIRFSVVR